MAQVNRFKRLSRLALVSCGAGALLAPMNVAQAADIQVIVPPPPPAPIIVEVEEVPRFFLSLEALYMTRRSPGDTPILIPLEITPQAAVGTNTVTDGLNAEDINYGWSFGLQGRVGMIADPIGFDIGGFWLKPIQAYVDMEVDDFRQYVWGTGPLSDIYITDVGAEAWAYTALHGVDANISFGMGPGLQVFAGAAYVHVKDDLQVNFYDIDYDTVDGNWTTLNRLIGPQIGVRGEFGQNAFSFGLEARVAYLFNSAFGSASLHDGPQGPLPDFQEFTDAAKDRTWMVAGGAHVGFNLSENIEVTLGYQAMWFSKLALAPAQVPNTNPLAPSLTLDTSSPLLVHGVAAGFTFRF